MIPPAPGRLYWICQAAGWGAFVVWVLGWYIGTNAVHHTWDVISIVGFNGVICPAVSHGLRRWMYAKEVHQRPAGRVAPMLVALVLLISAGLTAAVALGVWMANSSVLSFANAVGIFIGFAWAFSGWVLIYFAVHARRRRDALQLQLAVISRDAQLGSLRAQLNPHFLFNCLNSLRHLIAVDPKRAETMVTGLAELLRYSLTSDRTDMVSLDQELRIVDEYLALEQVRLDERLRVERAIDPAVLRAQVPPMLIQTLVDNAIKHGIAERVDGGVVRIGARALDAKVEISVSNTSVGTHGHADAAASADTQRAGAPDAGYGLRNARERLRLLYPGTASLSLTDANGMTHAVVVVPAGPA